MSNQEPYQAQPVGQPPYSPPAKQKSNTTLIVLIIAGVLAIPMLGCCVGLLLPAVQAAREAARRMSCSNNMRQIGLALHDYSAANGSLPPAYTVDDQGRPLHSWRTLILPYMEQEALYEQIDLTKPWDDPVNQAAMQTAVPTYACPSAPDMPATSTTYVAIVDPSGMMSGSTAIKFQDTTDGLSNTILFTETDQAQAVHWMEPRDIDLNSFMSVDDPSRRTSHLGGSHVTMGDGAVIFLTDSTDPNLREALITRAGGEVVDAGL